MRRLTTVLSSTAAVLLLVAAPALATPGHAEHADHGGRGDHGGHAAEHTKPAEPVQPAKHEHKTKPHRHDIELNGVLSDTPTATIGVPSDTSTVTIGSATGTATITLKVKGGDRRLHGTTVTLLVGPQTVVRRGDHRATLADLQPGDHVSVKARWVADGTWFAYRVNAAPHRSGHDD